MATLTAGFETGSHGNTISTGDAGSATPWDSITGSPTYDNTHAYGSLAMLTNADNEYCVWSTAMGTVTEHWGRVYVYLTANPAAVFQIARSYQSGSLCASLVYINSTGKLVIGDVGAALGTSTTSVSLNQWVRAEFHAIYSATVGFIEVKLFNDADSTTDTETVTSDSNNNTRANCNQIRIGRDSGGSTGNVWIDNVEVNTTGYPGPVTSAPSVLVGPFDPHLSAKAWF